MQLLVIHLHSPDNSFYLNSEKVGIYLCDRIISRHPLFAVGNDDTLTPIVITSCDIDEIQKQVNKQVAILQLKESIKELTDELHKLENDSLSD